MFINCMRLSLGWTSSRVSRLRHSVNMNNQNKIFFEHKSLQSEPISFKNVTCRCVFTIAKSSFNSTMCKHYRILQLGRTMRTTFIRRYCRSGRFEPTPEKYSYGRLISLAKSEKYVLLAAVGCLIVSSSITMSIPLALGKVIDIIFNKDGTNKEAIEKLRYLTFILIGVFIIGGIANFARVYLFNSASLRIVRELRSRVFRTILMQEASWFDTKGAGELINRLINDSFFVGNSLSQNLSDGLRSFAMVSVGTCMMVYTSPQLALVTSLVVPGMVGTAIIYGRYVRSITRAMLDKFADISKYAEERFGNVKTVKTFCREINESINYNKMLDDAMELGYKEVLAKSIFFGLTGLSGNVIIISVLYYGGTLVISDSLTIGALTSFLLYAGYTAISLNGLSNFYTELNKGVGAAQRLWEILDREYSIPIDVGLIPIKKPIGEVNFTNIQFMYLNRQDVDVLKDFSLSLLPGQTTAIVGRSGSGKTTIASLLLRLYEPQAGTISLDGVDIRTLSPLWLRSNISAVTQEPVLFSGTIRENIMYGLNPADSVSEELFQEVVREAHVHEFAAKLPQGLETVVGQRGTMLSGGQKQRVAIARALIKNPTILILDEATSALDSVSEQLVQHAINTLVQGRTVLTIAHRLSTIRNANKIAVLDQGRIVEEGTYESLMLTDNGIFKELVAKQAFISKSP